MSIKQGNNRYNINNWYTKYWAVWYRYISEREWEEVQIPRFRNRNSSFEMSKKTLYQLSQTIWVVWAVLKSLGNEWRNYNISHKLLRPSQFLEKIYENSGMVHFAEINQPPPSYSMLQYIGRVATPKLVSRNCLRYLQTTLIMGGGDWSQNLCEVLQIFLL